MLISDAVIPAWAWLAAGILVMAAEMLLPGVYLLWIGLAGVATGFVAYLLPGLDLVAELAVFAVFTVGAVILARFIGKTQSPATPLNERGATLVGRILVLSEPIVGGVGRAKEGDGSWRVLGPDLPAGSSVKVVAVEGGSLRVENS
ncbi:NfeD family protein [Lacibacterium aquatile]|uniref:NfeD family protein n=1 Tax=Lacibacterium aquatile TaxID=1168082 RepID=A0ABW5DY66_9PROT